MDDVPQGSTKEMLTAQRLSTLNFETLLGKRP